MTQGVLRGTTLEVVGAHQVVGNDVLECLLVVVQILGDIVVELLLESFELGLSIVVVTLKLSERLEFFKDFLAGAVVGEVAGKHAALKFSVVFVGDLELVGRGHGGVLSNVVDLVVEEYLVRVAGGR